METTSHSLPDAKANSNVTTSKTPAYSAPTSTPPDDYHKITAQEAADILGIHYVNLGRYRKEGKGPRFIKSYNKRIIYRLNDVLQWQAENQYLPQHKRPLA